MSTGAKSSLDNPDFAAVPRFLGARPARRFDPLTDLRMKVSSASTMPFTTLAFTPLAVERKRWRQRKAVSSEIPQRLAAFLRLSPSATAAAYENHTSRRCNCASGVPVSALKVFAQSLQR